MGCSIKNVFREVFRSYDVLLNLSPNCYVWFVKYSWFLNESKNRSKIFNQINLIAEMTE